jgi:hypothetical protein
MVIAIIIYKIAPPASSTPAPRSGLPNSVVDSLRQEAEDAMLAAAIRASTKNLTSEAPPPPKPSASTKPAGKPMVNSEDPWAILEQTTKNPKVASSAAPVSKPRPTAPSNTSISQNSNAHNPFGTIVPPARPIQTQQTLQQTMARPIPVQPLMNNMVNTASMMQAPLIPTPQTNPHNVFVPVAARPVQPIPQQPIGQTVSNPIALQSNFQNMSLQPMQQSMTQSIMMNPQGNSILTHYQPMPFPMINMLR